MASLVNPSNINGNFPIAGQDNDSQGFRDNFTNIRNNFTFIKAEVEDLQAKAVLKSALIGTTLNNDFQGSKVKNLQVSNLTETVKDIGAIDTNELTLDLSEGTIVKLLAPNSGDLAIADVIKNWPASLQHARLLLYITVPSTTFTLTLPASWSTDLSAIPGLRRVEDKPTISYTDPGDYVYEITSPDSGTTVFFRELTTGNAVFRDPNFYMVGIGIGSSDDVPQRTGFDSPTLMIGLGRYLGGATTNQGIGYKIDTLKSGNDTLVIKGSVTSYQSQVDDTANVSAGVNSLTSGGFSVVKDRTTITSGSLVTEGNIAAGDLVGYFNAIGLTKNSASTNLAYQQLGTVQFVAEGTTTSPFGVGGQILIKTKGDGTADDAMPNEVIGAYNYKATKGALRTAVTIDAKQNVTVHGNLTVMGETTVVESNTVTVEDKNIVLGNGGTETTNQGAGISVFSNAADGGANLVLSAASWITNRAFIIANTSPANALIVNGNAAVGGNLFVTGNLHVANVIYQNIEITTSTETVQGQLSVANSVAATSTTTGAIVTTGGVGIANGLYVNGTTFLQNVSSGNVLLTGGSAYDLTHLAATGGHVLTFNAANFTSANLWSIGGVIGVNPATGAVVPAANAYIGTGWFANLSTANAVITGGSISGISLPSIGNLVVTNFSTGNAVITGGYISALTNLNVTSSTVGTEVVTNFSTANARITGGSVTGITGAASTLVVTNFSTGNAVITSETTTTLVATNFSTGNAVVTGGSVTGITGAASTLVATNFSTGNAVVTGGTIQIANLAMTGGNIGMDYNKNVSLIGNLYTTIGFATDLSTSNLVIGAGTATKSPLRFTSGTNLTTPVAGSVEYDGTVVYATPSTTTGRGVVQAPNMLVLQTNTLVKTTPLTTAYYSVFGGPEVANNWTGNIQVAAGTMYEVEGRFTYRYGAVGTGVAGAATTMGMVLGFPATGAATISNYNYTVRTGPGGVLATTQTSTTALRSAAASNVTSFVGTTVTPLIASIVLDAHSWHSVLVDIKGMFRVTAAGNLALGITFPTAPGAIDVTAIQGSYLKLTPISSSASNAAIGSWTSGTAF
jgi:hypothetical protein